jgi:hypothetical protein
VDIAAMANNPDLPIVLTIDLTLSDDDVADLKSDINNVALLLLHSESIQAGTDSPLAFTQFLSTAEGQKRLADKIEESKSRISRVIPGQTISLILTMDHSQRTIKGGDNFSQAIITILDRRLPNYKTLFSLFPADRAFPQGDQNIQFGAGDAQQQLQSHMSNPTMKYARLKQTIIQNIMLSQDGREMIGNEFNLIFDNLLPEKKLAGISMNQLGLLKILVRDIDAQKTFDIDQMSSGEKGLVLTFLFLRLSMQKGGIVLLDEPELHLNAAVQEKILSFLIDHCVNPLSLQVFLCTHSPEIVRDAYEREDCRLFHLRAGDDLTPILRQDQQELFEVFERLGSSPADVLFARGNIYVEGEHDSQILQAGFPALLSGFKITALGGRAEIEREFPNLQNEEKSGRLRKGQLFVLDRDRQPTALRSSVLVKVRQLNRYCIENYLLDADIIYDMVSSHAKNKASVDSRGKFPSVIEELAFSQTSGIAMKDVYSTLVPESPGMRVDDFKGKTIEETAEVLSGRLGRIRAALADLDSDKWRAKFVDLCIKRKADIDGEWRSSWKDLCSGKDLIDDLYVRYEISMKKVEFKKEIIRRMAATATDDWRVINDLLASGLK